MEPKDIISSGLLELYVTGIASEEEVRLVQQYTKLYPEVKAELAEIEAGMESYAQAFALEPDPSVKDKIFSRINNTDDLALAASAAVTELQKPSSKIIQISSAETVF